MGRLIDADLLMEAYLADKKSGAVSMVKLIEEAPTVEKHGHWEWDDELDANVCSECGRLTYDSHDEYVEFMGSKVLALVSPYYCGYCGAKMRGGNDGNK